MARLAGPAPDPSSLRSGLPTDLVAIDRKALATETADRWSSASSFAAALEAFLAGTAVPGATPGVADPKIGGGPRTGVAGAAGGAGAGLAATSATARANPGAIPYAPEAYIGRAHRIRTLASRRRVADAAPAVRRPGHSTTSPTSRAGPRRLYGPPESSRC